MIMKAYRNAFYFLLLIPITVLVYEIRGTLIDMREAQKELFLLDAQRASQQKLIMGLEVRILHYVEGHEDEVVAMCPACFKNLMMEKYDHQLIRKFLRENGQDVEKYYDGVLDEHELGGK
jgi:hypothetical protein